MVDPSQITSKHLHEILRQDFPSFLQKCFHTLSPGTPFLSNWHIQAIAHHLELVRTGRIRRLIINLPPRSLKSVLCSVAFPAWVLGQNPSKRIISVSYGHELSVKHHNDFRSVLGSDWYRKAFPGTRVSSVKNTEVEFVTTRNGYRLSTSVDGVLTGRGGDLIVIDDPIKPADALSDVKLERVINWYNNTLLSRLDDKRTGAIIIVMQRLHMNDLAGTLVRNSDEWTVLSLPAIATIDAEIMTGDGLVHVRRAGDVLHPEREPLCLLEQYRRQLGSSIFQAQYQQQPIPPDGIMIKRGWIKTYEYAPTRTDDCFILQSWDTGSKDGPQNDYSVCATFLVVESKYYLLDVYRQRMDYPTLKRTAIALAKEYAADKILIEETGVGIGLIPELDGAGLNAIGVTPKGSKLARMSIQSAKFEAGHVFFPRSANWLPTLEAELFAFPHAGHDDQVDAISQALAHDHYNGYDSSMRGFDNYAALLSRIAGYSF